MYKDLFCFVCEADLDWFTAQPEAFNVLYFMVTTV